jgi:uncharacterized damage-inducible protein DinB
MKTVDFIRMGLEWSAEAALALIDDMKDRPLTFPTPKGGNHPLWVLGHLAWSEGEFLQFLTGRPNPLAHWKGQFGQGSEPSAEAARYPAFEVVRKAFQDLRAETIALVDSLTDADLDQPCKACPPELQRFLATNARCLLVAMVHPYHHRGQVADARRAAGRPPLRM